MLLIQQNSLRRKWSSENRIQTPWAPSKQWGGRRSFGNTRDGEGGRQHLRTQPLPDKSRHAPHTGCPSRLSWSPWIPIDILNTSELRPLWLGWWVHFFFLPRKNLENCRNVCQKMNIKFFLNSDDICVRWHTFGITSKMMRYKWDFKVNNALLCV